MSDDVCYLDFILFFGILFIEDTIGFVTQSDASEEIGTVIKAKHWIINTITLPPNWVVK
jgi:hypothetical protein